ncbi:YitT family protein [Stakelama sp. CBK3Z-3]|uniref:YitT family protein n=1 Tax=Stakelama flava TaxID=2860338 RepID=A0ABS6XMV0_9SPHN|nr:YitT family protein [Stakelama flava]MBW4330765.1 YitT family protein [Stakelama flava]
MPENKIVLGERPETEIMAHGILEDAMALTVGSLLIALGLATLHAAGLVTGGMAGLALLAGHYLPLPPGPLFALLNLPFVFVALRAMGLRFTVRTIIASALIAGLSLVIDHALTFNVHDRALVAMSAGALLGMGAIAVVRHGAGVGGIGVVTVWLGRTRGWNIGRTQLLIDCCILAVSALVLPPVNIAFSVLGAAAMGGVTGLWLRPGRYVGFSAF